MKIYAASEKSSAPPFLHLGYLAAASYEPGVGTALALLLLFVGLLLGFRTRRATQPRSKREWTVVAWRKGLAGIIGILLVVMGMVLLPASIEKVDRRTEMTPAMLEHITRVLEGSSHDLPREAGTIGLDQIAGDELDGAQDFWGSGYSLKTVLVDGIVFHQLVSPGPDMILDTEDDLLSRRWQGQGKGRSPGQED